MDAYSSLRAGLLSQEKTARHDNVFRSGLSPAARHACKIVSDIRKREALSVWTNPLDKSIYPTMSFPLAKSRIERTRLWEIIRRMPKGALLHAHFEGMVDMNWLLQTALETPCIYISSDVPILNADVVEYANIKFHYITGPMPAKMSLFTADYLPSTPVPFTYAASHHWGSEDAFVKLLSSRLVIRSDHALLHHQGLNAAWVQFESIFPIVGGLVFCEPILRKMLQRIFEQLIEDHVQWIDLRVVLLGGVTLESGQKGTAKDFVRIFGEETAAFKASSYGKGFWGARIIWTIPRGSERELVEDDMKICIAAKEAYPDLIAGYDLVSQENLGRTIREHLPSLLWFQSECKLRQLQVPFFFHAGEVLGDGDEHDLNLVDAICLDTRRIGHGYSLFKHPALIEEVKKRNICIEICPISNEVLRLNHSIAAHPLPALIANGVACTINSDVPGILGPAGTALSYDFWQVLAAFDNVGLEGLADMCLNSIRHAPFSDFNTNAITNKRVDEWNEQWAEYCQWIVDHFS